MFSETFYPVAEPDSVPKVYRRYNYQHLPPPSDPAQLMPDLRRGLRGAEKATFWGKVKSIGRRLRRVKFGKDREVDQILRPDFPVAPPPTPVPRVPKVSPDIHIMPVGSPEFPLSSPPSQEEGLLAVPVRSSRSTKPQRQESLPSSPRPLPTPPGPPSCPIPEIPCCLRGNNPSTSTLTSTSTSTSTPTTTPITTQPSPTLSLADTDEDPEEIEAARFFVEVAPFLFLVDNKCGFEDEDEDEDENESQDLLPFSSSDVTSSDNVPRPQDDAITLSSTQAEEFRDVAADRVFLEDLGLSQQSFTALLDSTDIKWGEDEAGED